MYIEYYGFLCYIYEVVRVSLDFNFDVGNILIFYLVILYVLVKFRCIYIIDVIVCRCFYGISKVFWGRIERS